MVQTKLQNINLCVPPGEFVAIFGPSGSGKTVLMEMAMGVVRPDTGTVKIDDVDLYSNAGHNWQCPQSLTYLPQSPELPNQATARTLLLLAAANRGKYVSPDDISDSTWCEDELFLAQFDKKLLDKKVARLSGGEKKRLALAAELFKTHMGLLVADEPTSGLDPDNEVKVLRALRHISRSGVTVIIVTHSVDSFEMFDRIVVLRQRKTDDNLVTEIAFDGFPNRDLMLRNIQKLGDFATDRERIGWLMSSSSADSHDPGTVLGQRALLPTMSRPQSIGSHGRQISREIWYWLRLCLQLQLRDWKTSLLILGLGVACVLSLQIGISQNHPDTLANLFAVAAPWLTSTYAAIFTTNLLRFYASEWFSGGTTRSFIVGLFSAFVPYTLIMAFVFTLGLWIQPNKKVIMGDFINSSLVASHPGLVKWILNAKPNENPIQSNPSPDTGSARYLAYPLTELFRCYETHFPRVERVVSSSLQNRTKNEYGIVFKTPSCRQIVQIYLSLTLLCAFGVSLGVWVAARFRKDSRAMITCVVVFVSFLVFSRISFNETGANALLSPLADMRGVLFDPTQDGDCSLKDMSQAPPLILSFFGLARYGFNLMFYYPVQTWRLCIESVPLFFGTFFFLLYTGRLLSNAQRMKRFLTRDP